VKTKDFNQFFDFLFLGLEGFYENRLGSIFWEWKMDRQKKVNVCVRHTKGSWRVFVV